MERHFFIWKESACNIEGVEDYNYKILGYTLPQWTQKKFGGEIVSTFPDFQGETTVVLRSSHTCLSKTGVDSIIERAERRGENIFFGSGWVLVKERTAPEKFYPLMGACVLSSTLDLPYVTAKIRGEIIRYHLRRGVVIESEEGVYIDGTVKIEKGAHITHNVTIVGDSYIKSGAYLHPYTIIEDSEVGASSIGPFAHLKKNCVIGENCRIGNFVEIKNAKLGDGSKAAHLSYVGDAVVGKRCNIGCGAIFVNYSGKRKDKSVVEDDCFIGSNCNLIAPITMAEGSFLAAGSTLTKDLQKGDLCIARERERVLKGRGKEYYSPKK